MPAVFTNPFAENYRQTLPAISIIIPTYSRVSSLLECLARLSEQDGISPEEYEVVIADDGSPDDTIVQVQAWSRNARIRLLLISGGENRGPSHARNQAMKLASGDILLITGDDILSPPDFLSKHLSWHREHPVERDALLGPVVWPNAPAPTPFMRWLERQGKAFYFVYPDKAGPVPPDRFYTCNVSLKRALTLRCGEFREDFPYASHEDLEFGLRLAKKGGMRLFFDPGIKAAHKHPLTAEGTVRRVYLNGCSSVLYWTVVPDHAGMIKRAGRLICRSVACFFPFSLLRRVAGKMPRAGWYSMLILAYWRGVHDATTGTVKE